MEAFKDKTASLFEDIEVLQETLRALAKESQESKRDSRREGTTLLQGFSLSIQSAWVARRYLAKKHQLDMTINKIKDAAGVTDSKWPTKGGLTPALCRIMLLSSQVGVPLEFTLEVESVAENNEILKDCNGFTPQDEWFRPFGGTLSIKDAIKAVVE
ncbi:hypothetical protein NW754_000400 [Fusarium falciforme]|nr:hypothetical protein NW754_000400 [Fusarium falciforme]KAJ4199360.1 hypothetical protein NW767_008169 [Fusarium falciforme]